MRIQATALSAVLPLVLMSGCLGGSSDRDEIEQAVKQAFEAGAAGDYETACSALTGRALGYLRGPTTRAECVRRGRRQRPVTEAERRDVAEMRVTVKRVEGDRARVIIGLGSKEDDDPFPILMRRVDGRWLISDFDPNRYGEKVKKLFDEVDRSRRTARGLDCSDFRFSNGAWREGRHDLDAKAPTSRQRLADAAVKCHTFDGLTARQLIELLGRPEDRSRRALSWTTGPERRFISLDAEYLTVELDAAGQVHDASVSP